MLKNTYTPEEIADYFDKKPVMEMKRAAYETGITLRTIYNIRTHRNAVDYKLSTIIALSRWITKEY